MLKLINPTQVRLIGYEDKIDQVKENLSYRDLKFSFELKRLKDSSKFFIANHGIDSYQDEVERISSQIKQCLLFQDESGYWTYSGLASKLALDYNDTVINEIKYPEPELISWAKDPRRLRPYQTLALEHLLKANHASVEMGTGVGKGTLILNIIKELGLKTLVMAPSINIANQLYADCYAFFGKHKVGAYFSNKKDSSKLITVGVAAGLTRIDESDSSWINLRDCQIFIADESHMCPAKTLAKVCFGLMAKAPYRFFFSGTQLRNDGSDLLLQAITGPVVFEYTVRQGIDQGYLAKPIFNMVKTQTNLLYSSKDVNKLTRRHLFYNPEVNQRAGQIANQAWSVGKRPTLILIEEIEQFNHILPFLRYPVKFAHGPLDSAGKAKIPKEYHSKDTNKLVKEFNEGKFPVLIGTSCVATGTDFLTVENIIYLRGGTSEIEVRQGLGRGTRMPEGSSKKDCYFWDFDVTNEEALHRHAKVRAKIYNEVLAVESSRFESAGSSERTWRRLIPGWLTKSVPDSPGSYTSVYEVQLPTRHWGTDRDFHFRRANEMLAADLTANPSWAADMEELIPGITEAVNPRGGTDNPPGWIWHHVRSSDAGGRKGVMRLVPGWEHSSGSPWWRALHPASGGAGGYSEWAIPAGADPN